MTTSSLPFKLSILAVAVALTACGGDDKKKSASDGLANNSVGEFVMSANGGNSTSYNGGDAGDVDISKYMSSTQLKVTKRGTPKTTYKLPTQAANFGVNPVTISSTTEIKLVTDVNELSAGDVYLSDGGIRLYKFTAGAELAAVADEVTGLTVTAGAVLTLPGNNGGDVVFFLANDIQNDGEIASLAGTDSSRPDLILFPAAYYGTGKITTAGVEPGQGGGDVAISASTIKNSGNIDASGADRNDDDAGDAGSIGLSGRLFVENNGQLLAEGGDSTDFQSGDGGGALLAAQSVYNSGAISIDDGTGKFTSGYVPLMGGPGSPNLSDDTVRLQAEKQLINTGDISANGASATEGAEGGSGKSGGSIYFELSEGGEGGSISLDNRQLANTGALTANGGDTASLSTGAQGGNGGRIDFEIYDGAEGSNFKEAQVMISGNLSANGGHASGKATAEGEGAAGGEGGKIDIEHDSNIDARNKTLVVGYSQINMNGGNGVEAGDGGDLDIETRDRWFSGTYYPSGPIEVATNISANSGQVVTSEFAEDYVGGEGGSVNIEITSRKSYLNPVNLSLKIEGDVSVNAGDVANGQPNDGGFVFIDAIDNLTVIGSFSANGGAATGLTADSDDYYGGDGGSIVLNSAEGKLSSNIDVAASGGSANDRGGNGGTIGLQSSLSLKAKGTATLNGGNADAGADDNRTEGGDGGKLLALNADYNAGVSMTISNAPGTGYENGRLGAQFINADCEGDCSIPQPN